MTLTYFNDINVYFHMKNHYKTLKQVKSVIDMSVPQSLLKSPVAMNSLQKRFKGSANEHLRKIYKSPIYMPKLGGHVKRHDCLNSDAKSEASLRTGSSSSRPTTRRNPVVSPKENFAPRSCSLGPPTKTEKMFKFRQKKRPSVSSTRSTNSEDQNINLQFELEKDNLKSLGEIPSTKRSTPGSENGTNSESPEKTFKPIDNTFLKESSEEHDYLLFLLRITEDIIVNDFYSNDDIKQVFRFHIEANKYRLDVRKMHFHIGNLCQELNIDCKEYNYDIAENDTLDSSRKLKTSPPHSCYLNNKAFLNCQDCSAIRSSSLYNLNSLYDRNDQRDGMFIPQMNNGDNDSSISPSLLRLLEKLSLGRVTECTEPAASTSTMNSPKLLIPGFFGREDGENSNREKSPMDFDTFVRELNSKEEVSVLQSDNFADKSSNTSPPVQVYTGVKKSLENTNLTKNPSISLSTKILPQISLNPKVSSDEDSKSEIEISEKDMNSFTNSENYEFAFENGSSNSTLQCDKSEKNEEEKVKHDEITCEKEVVSSQSNIVSSKPPIEELEEIKEPHINNGDKVVSIEYNQSPKNSFKNIKSPLCISPEEVAKIAVKNTTVSKSPIKRSSNLSPKETVEVKGKNIESVEKKVIQNQPNLSDQPLVTTALNVVSLQEDIKPCKTKTIFSLESPHTNSTFLSIQEHQMDNKKFSDASNSQYEKHDKILKVILQGKLDDSDYVMITGPVYVYKPLLESEPKLVVFKTKSDPKSRRNSADSQHSNRTFTVNSEHVREQLDAHQQIQVDNIDEAIQFDQSLHSLGGDSMEYILELTRRAYSQFTDTQLLESDYDLTPQKDSDKYHYLLADATTSVSGVNIKESLLLSDEYLMKSDTHYLSLNEQQVFNVSTAQNDGKDVKDIDSYLTQTKSKMFDNNYVISKNKKLVSSVSMPKLTTKNDNLESISCETLEEEKDMPKSGEMLLGYSKDLTNFDMPSQDSSLRYSMPKIPATVLPFNLHRR